LATTDNFRTAAPGGAVREIRVTPANGSNDTKQKPSRRNPHDFAAVQVGVPGLVLRQDSPDSVG